MLEKETIIETLKYLNLKENDNIFIHSSLKSIGKINGNAEALINTLITYFKDGLVMFPMHTWSFMKEDGQILNLDEQNSCVGTLSNIALRMGGKRSTHPTHSIVGFGKNIDKYLEYDLESTTPASPNGCMGHLKDINAKILFIGCPLSKNTFIHSIEELYNVPDRLTDHIFHFYTKNKEKTYEYYIHKHFTSFHPHISENYVKIKDDLLKLNIMKEFSLGNASCYIIDSLKCFNYVASLLKKNVHYFDKL